ncbi:MAG: sulfurtransferase [Gammaproteobacteria bacterium]|nr:sulfurtransferase [Gammaproteobacteria bacterium]
MFNTIIDAREFESARDAFNWVVMDCRHDLRDPGAGFLAYLEAHIPGAQYARLDDDLSSRPVTDHGRHPLPAADRLVEVFSRFGMAPGSQVIVYDDSGGSIAGRMWWMLRYMGHRDAAVLDGGWQAWLELRLPPESGEVQCPGAKFSGSPDARMLVRLEEVDKLPALLDSRDPARYAGESETIDPVAGHIPGARNYCWRRNLDPAGRFLPPGRLRQQLLAAYGATDPAEVTFYCGSGVSACHNVLAATVAGLPMPKLYVGSWSEWCADPHRPVATGRDPGAL